MFCLFFPPANAKEGYREEPLCSESTVNYYAQCSLFLFGFWFVIVFDAILMFINRLLLNNKTGFNSKITINTLLLLKVWKAHFLFGSLWKFDDGSRKEGLRWIKCEFDVWFDKQFEKVKIWLIYRWFGFKKTIGKNIFFCCKTWFSKGLRRWFGSMSEVGRVSLFLDW